MKMPAIQGLADDHVHSTIGSADARDSLMDLCETAIQQGLRRICLTEHLDFDYNLPEYGYYKYGNVLQAVACAHERFGDQLEISMGLEVDFEPRFLEVIPETLARLPVDFLLGSVHVYQGTHFAHFREEGRAQMPADALAALYRQYFSDIRTMIRARFADAIAHLDYPAKVGICTDDGTPVPGYAEELDETLALAVEYGIALEINTKRSRQGMPLAAPEAAVVRFIELGGQLITLGSDAHCCEQLGDGLDLGMGVLRQAGIPYQTIFRNRCAVKIPLE